MVRWLSRHETRRTPCISQLSVTKQIQSYVFSKTWILMSMRSPGFIGDSALHAAASNGALRTIEALIESGADVNQANAHSETPLHVAALNRYSQIVTLLVHQGAEIGRVDNEGLTALDVAAIDNNCDVLNSLLSGNAFSEADTILEPACIVSALFNAVENESEDALLLLAQKHQASDLRFEGGLTLFHHCNAFSLGTVQTLLEKGHNIDAVTEDGGLSLHTLFSDALAERQCSDILSMIQILGAATMVNVPDSNGTTPFHNFCKIALWLNQQT